MSLSKPCSSCAQQDVALFACQKPPHGRESLSCGIMLCKPCYVSYREAALLCSQTTVVCYRSPKCARTIETLKNPAIRCGCGKAVCDVCFELDEFIMEEKCQVCVDGVETEEYKKKHFGDARAKDEGADSKRRRLDASNGEARY